MATAAVPTAPKKPRASAAKTAAAEFKAAQRAADLLKMAGDVNRIQIICLLERQGEVNVTDLCTALGMSQPAVSHHLMLLRHGSLTDVRREGKSNFYSLTPRGCFLAKIIGGVMAEDTGR
jgi:DNA-binding transcriptional ArsR family regulator